MDCIRLSLFRKTHPARSPAILGETLELCSKKSHKPIFQCLEVEGGQTPEWFEAKGFVRRGASSTLNIGASPSVANSFQKRWCFWVWGFTNTFWCVFNIVNRSYAQAILYAFNFAMAILGLIKWRKEKSHVPKKLVRNK